MGQIRDKTGAHLFGVDPVQVLEWALRDWKPEERAEFHEFILVNGALSAKRVENEIYYQGGTATVHEGIDSRVFWLPDVGMVGVFNIKCDHNGVQKAGLYSGFSRLRNYFARVEYRNNVKIGIAYDAYKMLSGAQLMIVQRENSYSDNQARRKATEVYKRNETRFYIRLFPTVFLNLPLLLPSLYRETKAFLVKKNTRLKVRAAGADAIADVPFDDGSGDTSLSSAPQSGVVTTAKAIAIRDESGEAIYGIDVTKVIRWVLRTWKPEDIVDLTEIVVVGDDLVAKQVETKLLNKGAHALYKKDEESCTYGLKNHGAVQVINIARGRSRALASRNGSKFNLLRRLYGRLRYKTGRQDGKHPERKETIQESETRRGIQHLLGF